jgi:chromosome segregation ATPase
MTVGASRRVPQHDGRGPRGRGADGEAPLPEAAARDAGAPVGSASDALGETLRPELIDATHYDFDRLEHVVARLLEQHRTLQQENEALRARLRARDGEVERLESELQTALERRKQAIERVDALLGELDRLDGRLDEAMLAWTAAEDAAAAEPAPSPA